MKQCGWCKVEKPITDFYTRPRGGIAWECKDCTKLRAKGNEEKRKKLDPEKFKRQKANRWYKSTYNITLEQYEEMFLLQGGVCAICGRKQENGIRLCVDHDHKCCPGNKSCGKCIRKLLCNPCNTTLGKIEENPQTLTNMINYLETWGG